MSLRGEWVSIQRRRRSRSDSEPSAISQALPAGNLLLEGLPPDEREWFRLNAGRICVPPGDVLGRPDTPIEALFLPEQGLGSEIAVGTCGEEVETRCFGREGLTGWPILLGETNSRCLAIAATRMVALRVPRQPLLAAMPTLPVFRHTLAAYIPQVASEIAGTMLGAARHKIEHRLARWLLVRHDRLEGADLPFTHFFMARALGVRRASITNALHLLEGERVIRARRGEIVVIDRQNLQRIADGNLGVLDAA